jgi:hypothetical protein
MAGWNAPRHRIAAVLVLVEERPDVDINFLAASVNLVALPAPPPVPN